LIAGKIVSQPTKPQAGPVTSSILSVDALAIQKLLLNAGYTSSLWAPLAEMGKFIEPGNKADLAAALLLKCAVAPNYEAAREALELSNQAAGPTNSLSPFCMFAQAEGHRALHR